MCIDNLQLVLLCHETDLHYFGKQNMFERLVSELTDLEANGMQVNGNRCAVWLISVLGDNLGSHWLGGFSTSI